NNLKDKIAIAALSDAEISDSIKTSKTLISQVQQFVDKLKTNEALEFLTTESADENSMIYMDENILHFLTEKRIIDEAEPDVVKIQPNLVNDVEKELED